MDKCPICKKKTYKLRESFGGYLAMRCSKCGFQSGARNQKEFNFDISNFLKRKK